MVIKHRSFAHKGGYYFYRVHNAKLVKLGNGKLRDYLHDVFENCPHEYFNCGPRSSALKFNFDFNKIQVRGHEVNKLARLGLEQYNARYKTPHSKVQVFMLENDDNTIATEIPIWIKPNELVNFKNFFRSSDPLTGHIDILRIEGDKIWIWDYKPGAKYEKYADTQVFFYALMLSKRTGIDLDNFRCGYFDENCAFIFKPEKYIIEKFKTLFNY